MTAFDPKRTFVARLTAAFDPKWRVVSIGRFLKDRIKRSAKQTKGTAKEVVGKALGDAKLHSEGRADKIEGKDQNAVGGLKDALKEK
jgi:uncharacterized protein YjbJ (UPF0337 family)